MARQPKLKMLCGGGVLTRPLADALLERGHELWNLYGVDACGVWSSAVQVERGAGKIAIGAPLANTHFYVLNAMQRPVPVGVPGELYIGGVGLAGSHLPPKENVRLIANPFVSDPEARLYRTGDLVKFLPDGTLEFLGRVDGQRADPASDSISLVSRQFKYEAPRDAIEAKLVEIWERVLHVRPIGVKSNFFEIGGYSLTVVRLFAQINKAFDRNLPIATIFSAPTIEGLATSFVVTFAAKR